MGIKLLDGDGLQYVFSKIKSVLANKQDKLTLPLSVANGGTGNNSGTSSSVTTTEDTTNTLYVVGVTSNATTALKRDTSVTVKGNTITGNLVGSVTGNVTGNAGSADKLKTGRTLKVNLASTSASTSFDGTANISDIGVSGILPVANGGTGANSLSNLSVGTATNATNATTATKLNIDAGSNAKPVYFAGGKPVALTVTAGSDTANAIGLMYISSGEVKLITANSGTATKPVFVEGGVIKPGTYELKSTVNDGTANKLAYYSGNKAVSSYTSTIGASNKICYLNAGVPTGGITIGCGDSLPSSGSAGDIYILI